VTTLERQEIDLEPNLPVCNKQVAYVRIGDGLSTACTIGGGWRGGEGG